MYRLTKSLSHLFLLVFGLIWSVPFFWMLVASFKTTTELLTESRWLPVDPTVSNFSDVWGAANFPSLYGNTLWVVTVILLAQYIIITLAAFVFARREFPAKNFLFIFCMIQLFIPIGILLVPNYETMYMLGLINTKWAIVLPYFASSFGIFYLRQSFKSIPSELEEAAIIDGAKTWQLLRYIYVPLSKASLSAFGITSIIAHWNDFLWPLIVTNSPSNRPVTVGLALFAQSAESGAQWSLLSAATLFVIGPLIIMFILFQRKIIESFVHTGIK